jgi:nucleotide-binding universal stress UspA family protein
MYRHILIPTDGSELAWRGVAHGLALAKSVGAKVFAINVVAFCSDRRLCERAGSRGKCGQGGWCFLRDNSGGERAPHEAIIAAAEDKGCNLIVMSSHGLSGLSMLLIGSVTNKVLTCTKIPVLVCQ